MNNNLATKSIFADIRETSIKIASNNNDNDDFIQVDKLNEYVKYLHSIKLKQPYIDEYSLFAPKVDINFHFLVSLLDVTINQVKQNPYLHEIKPVILPYEQIVLGCLTIIIQSSIDVNLLTSANERDIITIFNLDKFNSINNNFKPPNEFDQIVKSIVDTFVQTGNVLKSLNCKNFYEFALKSTNVDNTRLSASNLMRFIVKHFPQYCENYTYKEYNNICFYSKLQSLVVQLYCRYNNVDNRFNFIDINELTVIHDINLTMNLRKIGIIKAKLEPQNDLNTPVYMIAKQVIIADQIKQTYNNSNHNSHNISMIELDYELHSSKTQMQQLVDLFLTMIDNSWLLSVNVTNNTGNNNSDPNTSGNKTSMKPYDSFQYSALERSIPYFTRTMSEFIPTLPLSLQIEGFFTIRKFAIYIHNKWAVYSSTNAAIRNAKRKRLNANKQISSNKPKPATNTSNPNTVNRTKTSNLSDSLNSESELNDRIARTHNTLFLAITMLFAAIVTPTKKVTTTTDSNTVPATNNNTDNKSNIVQPNELYNTDSGHVYAIIADVLSYLEFRRISFSAYKDLITEIITRGATTKATFKPPLPNSTNQLQSTTKESVVKSDTKAQSSNEANKNGISIFNWKYWFSPAADNGFNDVTGKNKPLTALQLAEQAENRAQLLVKSYIHLYLFPQKILPIPDNQLVAQVLSLHDFSHIPSSTKSCNIQHLLQSYETVPLPFQPFQSTNNNSTNNNTLSDVDLTSLSRQFFLLGLIREWIHNIDLYDLVNIIIPWSWNYISVSMKGANQRANSLLAAAFQRVYSLYKLEKMQTNNSNQIGKGTLTGAAAYQFIRDLLPHYVKISINNYPKSITFATLTEIMAIVFNLVEPNDLILLYFERLLLDKSLLMLSRARIGKPNPITVKITKSEFKNQTAALAAQVLLPPSLNSAAPSAAIQSVGVSATNTTTNTTNNTSTASSNNNPRNTTGPTTNADGNSKTSNSTALIQLVPESNVVLLPPGLRQLIVLQFQLIQLLDIQLFKQCLIMLKELFYSNSIACDPSVRVNIAIIIQTIIMRNFDLYKKDMIIDWYMGLIEEYNIQVPQTEAAPQQSQGLE